MVWQDIALMIVNAVFAIALVPQILEGYRKKLGLIRLEASIPTALGMLVITIAYFSMNLILATIFALVLMILWTIIVVQRLVYKPA